jgi:hypothetical protein
MLFAILAKLVPNGVAFAAIDGIGIVMRHVLERDAADSAMEWHEAELAASALNDTEAGHSGDLSASFAAV